MSELTQVTFSLLDYGVFGAVLLLSLLVGLYFAIRSRHKANEEFLVGSRSLTWLPVSMSLVVTYISAIAIQGERKIFGFTLLKNELLMSLVKSVNET